MLSDLSHFLRSSANGAGVLGLAAAVVWGAASVLLSPCHLSSLPLVVAFINGQGEISGRRALAVSALFAAGIMAMMAVLGLAASALGRVQGDLGNWVSWLMAAVFFLVGLNLLGVLPNLWRSPDRLPLARKGLAAALLAGMLFGLTLGPCTFAFIVPVLGIAFKLAGASMPYAIAIMLCYAVGHCGVIILAGTGAALVRRYLHWNDRSRGPRILKKVCGLLVILGGLYMIYRAA